VAFTAFTAFTAFLPHPALAATILPDDLHAGDLIRGQSLSAVYYYGEDGLRYVFPNENTYFTWYEDFDDVRWLSDSNLATIQIGGNVTYKPGVKMIKIQSSPTVYAVGANGTLHAIETETVASALYGSSWNKKIDDMPDGYFCNYSVGERIEFASQFDPVVEQQDALSINDDKSLRPYFQINIADDGYQIPTATIASGTAVRWVNARDVKSSVTEWDRVWGSGTLEPGRHYTRYFTQSGTWNYYDKFGDRNTFEGALIVQ
jgi:plastocyanin